MAPVSARQAGVEDLRPFAGHRVTAIDVVGVEKTREFVIRREIRVAVGAPLDPAVVEGDIVRLINLSLFADVRVSAREEEGGVRLEYRLKEMPAAIPYPAVSYTEENGFSVGVGMAAGNLAGRDITLSGRALFGGTSNYRLALNWPWITGNHVSFRFDAAHVERPDELRGFHEDSDEFTPWAGTYFAGDRGRLQVGASYFRMRSDVGGITLSQGNEDHLHRLGVSVGWDTRDSWNLPHRGWLNEVQVFRTGGFLGGDGDFWTVNADVRRFQPQGERRTLVVASLLTLQSGEAFVDVPAYMRYHLGGANTIRGYSVGGAHVSGKNQYLGTVELRHTVAPPHRVDILKWSFRFGLEVAAIGDVGYAWDTADQFALRRFRGGIGAGLRLLTPGSGMARFDVAWSREDGFHFHLGVGSKMARQRQRLR